VGGEETDTVKGRMGVVEKGIAYKDGRGESKDGPR
jgi:hypothetical protein